MPEQILYPILGSLLLIGAALLFVLRADRRRQGLQQRLRAIAAAAPQAGGPDVSLLRSAPQRALGGVLLLPAPWWARLEAAFAATGNRIGLPHLALAAIVAAAAVVIFTTRVLGLNPGLVIVVAGAAAAAAPVLLLRRSQGRYQNQFLDAFPDALDLVGRAVKAGLPVFDAMEVAAKEIRPPVGPEFQRTLDEMRIGVELETALHHTAERVRVPDFRFYVVALELQRRTGGSLAETLANLSNVIRKRKELRLKARALTSESRASALVLALLPVFVATGLYFINRDLMSVLFGDPRGRFMLGIAFLDLLAGMAVMRAIIKRALR